MLRSTQKWFAVIYDRPVLCPLLLPSMSEPSTRVQTTIATMRSARPTILPSLLLCDFANLEREVRLLEEAGVECLHLDVMDGNFVPNLSYGMPIVAALRKVTDLMLDVHLMIREPSKYAPQFVDSGADLITFHIEALPAPTDLLGKIRSQGVAAGLAINPSTDMGLVLPFVSDCDLVLVMSVEAGFGGQSFNPIALNRLSDLRKMHGADLLLEVDGGVNETTVGQCTAHGADLLVVGSAIFRQADYCQAMTQLRREMQPSR
jgi:ribulose-phosphate 3-epimerase